jgi:hypothetical protein
MSRLLRDRKGAASMARPTPPVHYKKYTPITSVFFPNIDAHVVKAHRVTTGGPATT